MAKNLRPGPKWIPAVIVERLGPLSYLVESNDCDLWRHHVKELSSADMVPTVSTPHSAVGAEVVLPASHHPPVISGSVLEPARGPPRKMSGPQKHPFMEQQHRQLPL